MPFKPNHLPKSKEQKKRKRENPTKDTEPPTKRPKLTLATPAGKLQTQNLDAVSHTEMSETRFDTLPVSKAIKRAIRDSPALGHTTLTRVQDLTIHPVLEGRDVLAKARTGSGKTLAFLIGIVQKLSTLKNPDNSIYSLIISPTCELAEQIASQAKALSSYLNFNVGMVTGQSSKINRDLARLGDGTVHILVATPGRLLKHLQNEAFFDRFAKLQFLVLDECDRLLDMGFYVEVKKIIAHMPVARQTLLFSATIPQSLHKVKTEALKREHVFIDVVGEDQKDIHEHIPQEIVESTFDTQIKTLDHILQEHTKDFPHFKVMVFFPTANQAEYYCQLFTLSGMSGCIQMHSRLNKTQRSRNSDLFTRGTKAILFSSDLTARGMDYPNVTLVVQVGLTTVEQYTHRLGRTGRAGRPGKGVILVSTVEASLLRRRLQKIPLETISPSKEPLRESIRQIIHSVETNAHLKTLAQKTYRAWLGYYACHAAKLGWDKPTCVKYANRYATLLGLADVPSIPVQTVGKMGLKGIPGLILERKPSSTKIQKKAADKFYRGK